MKMRSLLVILLALGAAVMRAYPIPTDPGDPLFSLDPIHALRTDLSPEVEAKGLRIFHTLRKNANNPQSWRPLIELGIAFKRRKDFDNAIPCFELVAKNSIQQEAYDWTADAFENLADLARWQNDNEKSLTLGNEALKYAIDSGKANIISEAHYSIGKTMERLGKDAEAITAYKRAISNAAPDDIPQNLGKAHLYIARIYKKSGNLEEAARYARRASTLFSVDDKPNELKKSYEILSFAQLKLGEYDKALESASLGLGQIAKSEIQGDEIVLLGYLSTIYRKIGFYDQALKHGLEALDIAEKTGNPNKIATAALQLAVIHETLGNLEETPIFLNRVFELKDSIQDKYTASALKTLSKVHSKNSNFDEALDAATESFDLYSKMGKKSGMAGSLFNTAEIHSDMGNIAAAIESYKASLENYDATSDRYGKSNCLIQLGSLLYEQGDEDKGISLTKWGISEAEDILANTLLIDGYRKLFSLLKRSKQNEEAALYAEKYILLKEDILSAEARSRISNLQFITRIDQKQKEINRLRSERIIKNLELEKNAQQIELLNGKRELQEMQLSKSKSTRLILLVSILLIAALLLLSIVRYRYLKKIKQALQEKSDAVEESNNKLQKVNQSKDQFFAMIAHDLKNSIGNLTFCIQFVNTDNFIPKDKDATALLKSLTRSATESHQLLLNLLQWAKMQMSIIELKEQPTLLIEAIEATSDVFTNSLLNKDLTLEILVDRTTVLLTDENVLKTILRNLLHNAIKFSNRGGKIVISGSTQNGTYELCVKDEGVGLPKDFQVKVTGSTKFIHGSGTEGEMGSGIGIAVCNWLLKLSNNELKFSDTKPEGTTVSFKIPLFIPETSEQAVSTQPATLR